MIQEIKMTSLDAMFAYQKKIKDWNEEQLKEELEIVRVQWKEVHDRYWSEDLTGELSEEFHRMKDKMGTVSDYYKNYDKRMAEKAKGEEMSQMLTDMNSMASDLLEEIKEINKEKKEQNV